MRNWYIIFSLFLISCGASNVDQHSIPASWPAKKALVAEFRNADTVYIIYGKEDYAIGDLVVNGIANAKLREDMFTVIPVRDDEVTEKQITSFPIYVVGTKANLILNRINDHLPIHFFENGFEFDGKKYTQKDAFYKISFYPNLYNPQLPLTVISGNNEDEIVKYMQSQFKESWGYFYWDNWGYQIYADGKRTVLGNFSNDSTNLWAIDKKLHWDFDYEGKLLKETKSVKYYSHNDVDLTSATEQLAINNNTNIEAIENFTHKKLTSSVKYHLYKSSELKALMLNNADQNMIDFEGNAIHGVITEEFTGKYDEKFSMLVIRNILGMPKIMALEEGLAVKHTQNWQSTSYNYLAGNLALASSLPTIKALISNEAFEGESDYLMHIASASLVDFLISKFGEEVFLSNYSKWDQDDNSLITMDAEWYAFAAQSAKLAKIQTIRSTTKEQSFYKGFNYAHEGYQIYNGYMGSTSDNSIAKLKELGVNSLTIIPYSGFKSMTEPFPFRYTSGPGSENDVSIIHAAHEAHQNGMSVMLKPQLWSWLGWTGDITMQSEKDWLLFFEYYEQWIMHYALMAEMYRFEMFCIGVEFQNASLSEHNKWDDLFDKVRKIYTGKITYAANWGKEFETVSFWDKLDFIAVNCYYPLSNKTNPTDQELLTAFEKNLDLIEKVNQKYKLPVVFTEIGFKSIASPWILPHKDDDDQAYSEESQKRCYDVMIKAMDDEPWIKGVYLWKWPSYMDFSKENNKDFTPCGKLAEKSISNWFLNSNN